MIEKIFLVKTENLLELLERVYKFGVEDGKNPIPKNQNKLRQQGLLAQISCLEKGELTKEVEEKIEEKILKKVRKKLPSQSLLMTEIIIEEVFKELKKLETI